MYAQFSTGMLYELKQSAKVDGDAASYHEIVHEIERRKAQQAQKGSQS